MSDDVTTEGAEAEVELTDETEVEAPDLAALGYDELIDLETSLLGQFSELTAKTEFSADDADLVQELVAGIALVREELDARDSREAARQAAFAAVEAGTKVRQRPMAVEPVVAAASTEEATDEVTEPEAEVASAETEVEIEASAEVEAETDADDTATDTDANTVDTSFAIEGEPTVATFNFSPAGLTTNIQETIVSNPNVPVMRASADVPGFNAGQELPSLAAAAQAFAARRKHITGTEKGNDGNRYLIASIEYGDPGDAFRLDQRDSESNERKINASQEALVASGGYCAPAEVLYDLTVLGADACRPVQNSLPVFQAERGSVRFAQPPVFNAAAGAVRVNTNECDEAGYPNTPPCNGPKPCLRITCGAEIVCDTDAVSRCLTFGNFGSRTWPEQVEAWLKLSIAAQAQVVEQYFLDGIKAGSTPVSGLNFGYGATRSLLHTLGVAVVAWRSRYRYCGNVMLNALMPWWVKELLRIDLANDSYDGHVWDVSDAQLDAWFASRGVRVVYYQDTPTTGVSQVFSAQPAGPLNNFPTAVQIGLYPAGSWFALSGGSLDLGLVRDSTLNSTNDYQIWSEEWIGVCNRGHESMWLTMPLCPNGAGAASVAAYTC